MLPRQRLTVTHLIVQVKVEAHMADPRLYVGNLPYAAQKVDVQNLFAEHDIPTKKIDISIDPFNGRSPGYCFVDFETDEDAAQALEKLPGQLIRGLPVKVNYKTERRVPPADRLPTKVYDRGSNVREVPTKDVGPGAYVYDRWAREDAPSRWTAPQEEGRRLYVGGLPQIRNQDTLNAEMRTLFENWNVEAVSKIISPPADRRSQPGSHYYCFVDLPSEEAANEAIEALNGTPTPYGGTYRVNMARGGKRPTKVEREQLGLKGLQRRGRSTSPPARDLAGSWRRKD